MASLVGVFHRWDQAASDGGAGETKVGSKADDQKDNKVVYIVHIPAVKLILEICLLSIVFEIRMKRPVPYLCCIV